MKAFVQKKPSDIYLLCKFLFVFETPFQRQVTPSFPKPKSLVLNLLDIHLAALSWAHESQADFKNNCNLISNHSSPIC